MAKKIKNTQDGFVYSTNPDFEFEEENPIQETLLPQAQKLKVFLENLKGNKQATVIAGFVGSTQDLENLAKAIKNKCATGGTVKNGEIIIQGNFVQKITDFLTQQNYKLKK